MRAFIQSFGKIPVHIPWLQIFAICLSIKGDDSLRILIDMLSMLLMYFNFLTFLTSHIFF